MKCFNTEPHKPHTWTFLYDEPISTQECPGTDAEVTPRLQCPLWKPDKKTHKAHEWENYNIDENRYETGWCNGGGALYED